MTTVAGAWLDDPDTRAVAALLTEAGQAAYFVGGCVRNALLSQPVSDIDIATDAVPARVIALAEAAGVRAVPTGIEHGTVTLVRGGRGFEVTTFRRDVETFGRRAVVAFATDIAEDAARRDFTMNALYARPNGIVVDPLGGLPDLRAARVRFVGDPAQRIAEDYLRILRFFRFHAWYGDPDAGLDLDGLAACRAGRSGLADQSRERVGAEMSKLLAAADPGPSLIAMAETGVLAEILPGTDPAPLLKLVAAERAGGYAPDWRRRLAALRPAPSAPEALRLSKADRRALEAIAAALAADEAPAIAAYRHGVEAARDAALIRAALADRPLPPDLSEEIARGADATLPVRAADLSLTGPALGAALRQLEEDWIASGFRLDRAALLGLVAARS